MSTYVKGDEFWHCVVSEIWNGGVVHPRLQRGVVTGGGDIMIRYQMDGDRVGSAESRYRFEARISRTRAEAIEKAIDELDKLRTRASRTIDAAADAIAWLIEQQSEEVAP